MIEVYSELCCAKKIKISYDSSYHFASSALIVERGATELPLKLGSSTASLRNKSHVFKDPV